MSDPAQSGATVAGGGGEREREPLESPSGVRVSPAEAPFSSLRSVLRSAWAISGGSLMSPIAMVVEPSSCLIW